ncbi:MAG: 23S rRNA (pseudouridine(1915)-N(3))-methyltransferase RlmH [Proteobacteria bacterium]|nr:23S rRNA (pseudouridine(1915)-N(3))-methyltransferase RlmH [Pseudomonadota bacterium]
MKLVAVGRVRDRSFAASCDDYTRRIGRYGPFETFVVKEARGEPRARAQTIEGERLLGKLPRGCRTVVLDEHGRDLTTMQLSQLLDARHRDLRFVIGGAWGLSDAVKARADDTIRLSSMTLPHELARVVLLEQLYRAWTIIRREPYHNP